jgi:hypothetical protein
MSDDTIVTVVTIIAATVVIVTTLWLIYKVSQNPGPPAPPSSYIWKSTKTTYGPKKEDDESPSVPPEVQ